MCVHRTCAHYVSTQLGLPAACSLAADSVNSPPHPSLPPPDLLIENEPVPNKYVSLPHDIKTLNCAAFNAGVIQGIMCAAGFVSGRDRGGWGLRAHAPPPLASGRRAR